jgi:hypothetical protein
MEKNEMGGACSMYGEMRDAYRILVGRCEEKILLGRPRHRWEDNIKLIFQKEDGQAWTGSMWFKINAGTLTRLRFSKNAGNILT